MDSRLTRRRFNVLAFFAAIAHTITPSTFGGVSKRKNHQFVHPGMLHTNVDLARMKDGVLMAREPINSGFNSFRMHPNSQSTYVQLGPSATIGRNPTIHVDLFDSDANAAYQCALMWCITGDHAYARVAIRILNGWASTLKQITGRDAVLCASLGGFKMVNAAELVRHTGAGWDGAAVGIAEECFRKVLLPVLSNFAPFANGNWDTAAIKCMMAIGIFCDDADLVDNALQYYLHGCGDGRLENYVYPGGQCQESGRDQQHTQLGLAHMGDTCEMAWNQGLDLYGAAANRLLEGFEYTARYNLGSDVAFTPDHDRTGKYSHQVISPRSAFRPVYEQIYSHYVNRKRELAPYTQHVAERLRPEGAPFGADHTGFGTLLYSRTPDDPIHGPARAVSAALFLTSSTNEIRLQWIASNLATSYSVCRSNSEGSGLRTIASNVREAFYVDRNVIAGRRYFYRVNPTLSAAATTQLNTVAGLPLDWSERTYGESFPAGGAQIEGDTMVLKVYGARPFGLTDELHFVYRELFGDGVLSMRLSPMLASQQATVGLMLRTDDTNDSPMIALSLSASSAGEQPSWAVSLLSRKTANTTVVSLCSMQLDVPFVKYGRIDQPVWMRVSRHGNELKASLSPDGHTWIGIGQTSGLEGKALAGCFACSGLGYVSAQVTFEQLKLKNK